MDGHYERPPQYDPAGRPRPSLLISTLLAAAIALAVTTLVTRSRWTGSGANPDAVPRPVTARGDLAADEQATIELFDQASRSVVYVSPLITRRVRRSLFGAPSTVVEQGTGSGFIWNSEGHVVTNYHVIEGASRCLVTLPDGSTHEARLTGAEPDKDIAVLWIDAPRDELVPIPVGTSHDLRVGQKTFAIGNPYGLDFTLTTGVVGALDRQIESVSGRTIKGVIQTDAAINPGNSGGPLLDSAGRLIGMNTSILSGSGSSAGIGFAVPVDTINRVVPQLIAHGEVTRPGLGIYPASDAISRRYGLPGVLVLEVMPGSAAEQAGLRGTVRERRVQLGDIIVSVGEIPTPNNNALLDAPEEHEIGETVDVAVVRDGRSLTVPVTLQAIQ